jgi:chitodextrinase
MTRYSMGHRTLLSFLAPGLLLTVLSFVLIPGLGAQTKSSALLSRLAVERTVRLRASFTVSPAYAAQGQPVQFIDTSTGSPTTWQWDFGDEGTSVVQMPSHAFASTGFYKVTLTVGNGSATKKASRIIIVTMSSFSSNN